MGVLGFEEGNWTGVPNRIFDELLCDLSLAELRCLLFICRRTMGFQKRRDSVSLRQFEEGVCDGDCGTGLSQNSIRTALQSLIDKGLICETPQTTETGRSLPNQYELRLRKSPKDPHQSQVPSQNLVPYQEVTKTDHTPLPNFGRVPSQNLVPTKESLSKETNTEKETISPDPFLSSQASPENPPSPELPLEPEAPFPPVAAAPLPNEPETKYDIQITEDVITFVTNAYRQNRGAKLENLRSRGNCGLCDRIKAEEAKWGVADFRVGLWNYLNETGEWLREHRWPIQGYLKNVREHLAVVTNGGFAAAAAPAPPPRMSGRTPIPAIAPSGSHRDFQESKNIACELVHTWDSIVPDKPIGELTVRTRQKLEAAAADPDFVKNFPKLCERMERIFKAKRMDIEFGWLFTGKPDPHWHSVLEGDFSWAEEAKPDAKAGPFSKSAGFAAQLKQEREAKKKS